MNLLAYGAPGTCWPTHGNLLVYGSPGTCWPTHGNLLAYSRELGGLAADGDRDSEDAERVAVRTEDGVAELLARP